MKANKKNIINKFWQIQRYDTFSNESYVPEGKYFSEKEAEKAAKEKLEEIEKYQPSIETGGPEGIQDHVYIIRPDRTEYRYTANNKYKEEIDKNKKELKQKYNKQNVKKIYSSDSYALFQLKNRLAWLKSTNTKIYNFYDKDNKFCFHTGDDRYILENINKGYTVKLADNKILIAELKKSIKRHENRLKKKI